MYNSAWDAMYAFRHAYWETRNIAAVLTCMTEDIIWIGTEESAEAVGKTQLQAALLRELKEKAGPRPAVMDKPTLHSCTEGAAVFTMNGAQTAGGAMGTVRATVCCMNTPKGWLVGSVHFSDAAAKRRRRMQDTLLSGIPGGIAMYRLKKDGRITTDYVSDSLSSLCGCTADELFNMIRDNALNILSPEDVENTVQSVLSAVRENLPISLVYRVGTKDRKELWTRLDAKILPDSEKQEDDLAVICAIHTKVSDEAKKTIQERQRYRMILDCLDVAYFEWTEESGFYASETYGRYAMSRVNQATILQNGGSLDLVASADLPALHRFFDLVGQHPPKASAILRCKMMDGTYRWTEMTGFYDYDEAGRCVRAIGIMRDVNKEWEDQRRQLREALESEKRANRTAGDFLANVSHDMRTPMNGILGIAALTREENDPEQLHRDIEKIEESGRYMLSLINDTLDIQRARRGKVTLALQPTYSDELLNAVESIIRPTAEARKIEFSIQQQDPGRYCVRADAMRVRQIFVNLLSNSVKFTPPGGRIELLVQQPVRKGDILHCRFEVRDNGVGMSEHFLREGIFQPFSQERNTLSDGVHGSGLGLSIVKSLVEVMGGYISVQSALGKGTVFTLLLDFELVPDNEGRTIRRREESQMENVKTALAGKHILLCEDHPINAEITRRMLELCGCRLDWEKDGQRGVERYLSSPEGFYDAILMDIRMPVMDGLAAAAAIRASRRGDAAGTPIIAMSANAFPADVKKSMDAGMNAHLAKPIGAQELYREIMRQCGDGASALNESGGESRKRT